ncbi:MAG: LysE family transporter [Pseudomonadota bacterium]
MSLAEAGPLLASAAAFFVAAAAPGPATLAVAGTAMAAGRRAALVLGAGLTLGLAAWGGLVGLGLGALVLASPTALLLLRLGGGAILLWFAWQSARAALARGTAPRGVAPAPAGALFARGFFLNLLNPKAALAWAAVIAIGLPADPVRGEIALIVATCATLGGAIYTAYALGFSTAPVRAAYARARRWIEGVVAALFAAAGARLILDRGIAAP